MALPRLAAVGLLAVVPVALYFDGRGVLTAALTALSVLIIVASLAHMLSPAGPEADSVP